MTLTDEVKRRAMEVGFVSVGISSPNRLRGLPHACLDFGFSRWKGEFPKEQVRDCYATLKKTGFFKMID